MLSDRLTVGALKWVQAHLLLCRIAAGVKAGGKNRNDFLVIGLLFLFVFPLPISN
ncbi:MAG: hypothetical protein Ct9H300mP5_1430 [Candidatus Pelagibacterales bacterium]|nr:MAG: hypothetical protein Ct9H300mP5_1430 [Pelagibacterales bacterium]